MPVLPWCEGKEMEFGVLAVAVAFGAGVVSFASPCVLPLVPAYLAYLAGLGGSTREWARATVALHALVFVLGFSLVFTSLWIGIGLMGYVVADLALRLRQLGGLLLVVLGLHVAGLLPIPTLWQERRLSPALGSSASYGRSLLIGVLFAAGWTPCIGPVLAGIIGLATLRETVWQGSYLLVAYSLGLGVPFILSAFALERLRRVARLLMQRPQVLAFVSGSFLIAIGMLMLSGSFTQLARFANGLPQL